MDDFALRSAQSRAASAPGGLGRARNPARARPRHARIEDLRALYRYADFDGFLKAFGAVGKRLRTPADYALVTRRLLERLAAQNVRYAEITLAAGVVLWKRQEFAPIFDAVRGSRGRFAGRSALDSRRRAPVWRGARHGRGELAAERAGSRRGGLRHRRQRRARPGRVVRRRVRLRRGRRPAPDRARRRKHRARIGLGRAALGRRAHRPRHRRRRRTPS